MVAKIADFIGEYIVTKMSEGSALQPGMKIYIGDGQYGATQPTLTDGLFIVVGFAILQPDGITPVLSSGDGSPNAVPLVLVYDEGTLWWKGFDNEQKPLRIYMSLAQGETVGGLPFRALYGTTLSGDPEQVGVWGADGNPSGG